MIAPIFDALIYCHALGIVHRDIKPENLLFNRRDFNRAVIKVSDFGLARFVDEEKLATTTCGTPGYVAPEVLEQRPYNQSCDFWSVGVVLFILLSGGPPFYNPDQFEMFEKIKRAEYSFEALSWQGVSAEAKDLITKLLVADPAQRLNGEQIMAHPWILGQTQSIDDSDIDILNMMRNWNSGRIRHVKPDHSAGSDESDELTKENSEEVFDH